MSVCAFSHGQTYVVGVEKVEFAPHYRVDAEGHYQGFARELLDLFASRSGLQLEYRPMPVDQLLPALLQGQIDFKYPDNPQWSQAQKAGKPLVYSQGVVAYVDGALVAPERLGKDALPLQRLAMVDGWTAWGYQEQLKSQQLQLVRSGDLRQMIKQTLKKEADGAYFNVVVATHYLDNVRARPGALVFDPRLPHTRSSFSLSSLKQGGLLERFDRFLIEERVAIAALKDKYRVEANIDSEFIGVEQWKVDFLKRQKAKEGVGDISDPVPAASM
ncbi:MAG: transporter substrate-binding domain-containing protein [Pseudomonas sp.]|uniref:transporter substrate-binding domain-containing protein n=1 Tax=Pseudomonas sp. TaxID=306 RepID=UPI00339A372C